MVTHDMAEAGKMADQIVLLVGGQVVQQGSLRDILLRPAGPLVRDFLRTRLSREAGEPIVIATHLRIAAASERHDWNIACFHYGAAGRAEEVHRVLRHSLQTIMSWWR